MALVKLFFLLIIFFALVEPHSSLAQEREKNSHLRQPTANELAQTIPISLMQALNSKIHSLKPNEPKHSIEEIVEQANNGDPHSQYVLGAAYYNGYGFAQDYKKSAEWHEKAASQNYIDSQLILASMYMDGKRIVQNYSLAGKWYKKAALLGDLMAMVALSDMYRNGQGISQDYVEAHKWINLATARGAFGAKERRDDLEKYMTPSQIIKAQHLASEWEPIDPDAFKISLSENPEIDGWQKTGLLSAIFIGLLWFFRAFFKKTKAYELSMVFRDNLVQKKIGSFFSTSIRVCAFTASTVVIFFIIVMADKIAAPLLLGQMPGNSPISLPATLIFLMMTIVLFRKIVLGKNSRYLLISIVMYFVCNALSVALLAMGETQLAIALGWIGVFGIIFYYGIIRPFKKPMVEQGHD